MSSLLLCSHCIGPDIDHQIRIPYTYPLADGQLRVTFTISMADTLTSGSDAFPKLFLKTCIASLFLVMAEYLATLLLQTVTLGKLISSVCHVFYICYHWITIIIDQCST